MSEKNIQLLMQKNLDPYIPERTDKNNIKKVHKYKKEGIIHASFFTYDDQRDVYICPENQILKLYYEFYDKRRLLIRRVYRGINCRGCKSNQQCTNRKDKTRQLKVNCLSNDRKCLKEKMRTVKAQRTFEERKYTVEPAIGNYKQNLKFREFITRGLNSVKNEFNLVCAAINLKKLWLQSNNANN